MKYGLRDYILYISLLLGCFCMIAETEDDPTILMIYSIPCFIISIYCYWRNCKEEEKEQKNGK